MGMTARIYSRLYMLSSRVPFFVLFYFFWFGAFLVVLAKVEVRSLASSYSVADAPEPSSSSWSSARGELSI
jgi:hypothetical protein